MWSYRWAESNVKGDTSTTLVRKASWIIVQRWYCAGPRLNHARDVSLGTSVVTEKERLVWHQESNRFSLPFLSLFFSLSLFLFFQLFFTVLTLLLYQGKSTQRLTAQLQIVNPLESCGSLQRNFAVRSNPLERRQLQLSRLYLNTSVRHHMNPWW